MFMKFTGVNNTAVYADPEKVVGVSGHAEESRRCVTRIYLTSGAFLEVIESPREVIDTLRAEISH
jgi:hypothetical protein